MQEYHRLSKVLWSINSLIIDYGNEDVQSYWEDVVLPNLNDNGNKSSHRDETIQPMLKDGKPVEELKELIHDDAVWEDQRIKTSLQNDCRIYRV